MSNKILFGSILDLNEAPKPQKIGHKHLITENCTIFICFKKGLPKYVKKLHFCTNYIKIDLFWVNFGPRSAPLSPQGIIFRKFGHDPNNFY